MVDEFERRSQQSVTTKQCKSYVQSVKKDFGVARHMESQSGFGWNHVTKMVDSTDDVWDAYVKVR